MVEYAISLPADPEELLGPARTAEYIPSAYGMVPFTRNRPPFTGWNISEMLTDPRLQYALWLLKGPILANARMFVKCDDSIKPFIVEIIERFWRNDAIKALKAIEWGYTGAEVVRSVRNGHITFDNLNDLQPSDVRVVTDKGQLCGITVNNVPFGNTMKRKIFLGGPKAFHHVHWKEKHPWYGLSRFFGCYVPWWEIWTSGGFRDIRRLWFFQNCFEGGSMYHPPGSTMLPSGVKVANKDLARDMIEKKRAGATLALPNTGGDGSSLPLWRYEPATPNAVPAGLLEYGKLLNDEELEGMGIPPEVIESGGDQGFGSATGRQVPQTAYYAVIQELFQGLISSMLPIIRTDVAVNYSEALARAIDIVPFPMGQDGQNQENFNGNQFVNEDLVAPGQPNGPESIPGQEDQPISMSAGAEPFTLKATPKHTKGLNVPTTGKGKQVDLFAGRGDAPGQTSFFDHVDPKAKNVADARPVAPTQPAVKPPVQAPTSPVVNQPQTKPPAATKPKSTGGTWITIGGSEKNGVKHHGGFPVRIDGNGTIIEGGPGNMKGVHLSKVGEHFDKQNQDAEASGEDKFEEVNDFFDDIAKGNNAAKANANQASAPGNTRSLTKIINYQAGLWGMPPEVYADYMDKVWADVDEQAQELEYVKKYARDALGKDARNLRIIENGTKKKQGGDYTNLIGADTLAKEIKEQHPHYFASGNDEQDLWNLISAKAKRPPSKVSREFHEMVDVEIQRLVRGSSSNYAALTGTPTTSDEDF